MKNIIFILFFFFSFSIYSSYAQENTDATIREGMYLYDKKNYTEAIEKYEKVLSINPTNERAMYELSLTYLAMDNYMEALKYSTKVINANYQPLLLDAYNVKGAALAGLQKYDDSIVLLNEAVKRCGDDYLLYYNLGLSYFKNGDNNNAIIYLEKSIDEEIGYSESYYLYAYALSNQNRYIEAILAFDSFLLLEPDDERAKNVFLDMMDILQNKMLDEHIKNMPKDVDFSKIKNALISVKKNIYSVNEESEYLFFQESTKSILAELKLMQKENSNGMFWDYLVPTFTDILNSGYFNTFCRYISAANYPSSLTWWKENQKQVEEFTTWFESTNNENAENQEGADSN